MVYMFLILGNAGFISSTVCAEWELLGILWWESKVVKPSGNFNLFKGLGFRALGLAGDGFRYSSLNLEP